MERSDLSRLSLIALSSIVLLAACDTATEADTQSETDIAAPIAGDDGPPPLPGQIDRARAGSQLPEFSFQDPQGNTLDSADLKGTPVLLNLWATWCAPCRKEMPLLDNLADELGDDVRVLTISQDSEDDQEKVVEFFKRGGLRNLEQWLDPKSDLGVKFAQGNLLPTTILFDENGEELLRVAGDFEWDGEEAIAAIREAIAE